MARSPLKLGMISVGASMDCPVAAALGQLPRLELDSLYDPCYARCVEAARRFSARPAPSLMGLLQRVDGVIIGEAGWLGPQALLLAAERQRPALALEAAFVPLTDDVLRRLAARITEKPALWMPELRHRWARTTLRLRELTATKLGAIDALDVVCRPGASAPGPALDWCCNVMQSEPRAVASNGEATEIQLSFRRAGRDGAPVQTRLRVDAAQPADGFPILEAQAVCRHGRVWVRGETTLDWQTERPVTHESLDSDRGAVSVMLDLFGRRLAGGIVPVPDLGDLVRLRRIASALETARAESRTVRLDDV